tara:strand:- start:137 stop:601 length:465 start_codon:yes stop_codon:yes gene_type:complete
VKLTELFFYQLQVSKTYEVLPKLLEKTLEKRKRALVLGQSDEEVIRLSELLWSYKADSWLPHGSIEEPFSEKHPVLLSKNVCTVNDATFLFVLNGVLPNSIEAFERCSVLCDEHAIESISSLRKKYSKNTKNKYHVTFWQEDRNGRWHAVEGPS